MLDLLLDREKKTQIWLSEATHIHKNRISDIVRGREDPRPDEIWLIDRELKQNRRLVLNYCSQCCPAGKYCGYHFDDMDAKTAGLKLITALATMDKLLPEIADMICAGRIRDEMLHKLSQLRISIMALEVQLTPGGDIACCNCSDVISIHDFLEKKKLASVGALTSDETTNLPRV